MHQADFTFLRDHPKAPWVWLWTPRARIAFQVTPPFPSANVSLRSGRAEFKVKLKHELEATGGLHRESVGRASPAVRKAAKHESSSVASRETGAQEGTPAKKIRGKISGSGDASLKVRCSNDSPEVSSPNVYNSYTRTNVFKAENDHALRDARSP